VTFECGSKLSSIEGFAFSGCCSLLSICIPSSVEALGRSCFHNCVRLSNVSFEPGSKLASIDESAFEGCPCLSSIGLPSSIRRPG
jgi:hypothetical protein